MSFRRLTISGWQQFREIEVDFHERLTILTGANGSGKTTILNLLAQHHDWPIQSLATPTRRRGKGPFEFLVRLFHRTSPADSSETLKSQIGTLVYTSGQKANLVVPQPNAPQYQVQIEGQQSVACFFIPSHRPVYIYEAVSQIPAARQTKDVAFQRVWNSTKTRYFGGGERSASFHMKELLISWSIFGRGNVDMSADEELLSLYLGFQEVLRKILPQSLGFRQFAIRNMEIVLQCESGDFLIDAASGGLSSLIDTAWQLYMFAGVERQDYTVLIDEVENHLHPTMQRAILPNLLSAFPQARFIVATHSPLIVGSVKESEVYVLRYDSNHTIESERLAIAERPRTASEILNEALGVSFTYPIWAEKSLEQIAEKFATRELNEQSIKELENELKDAGLDQLLPKVLEKRF